MSVPRRVQALRDARAKMTSVREEVLAEVRGRSRQELMAPPAAGGWCAAEILDHLHTAESKLVKGLEKRAKGEPVRIPRRAWFYRLPMGLAFTDIKIKAPGPVRPRAAKEIEPFAVLDSLATSRQALLGIAERLGEEPFSRLVFPHFLLGRFDGLDWFRFVAGHEARHLAQLKRTLPR